MNRSVIPNLGFRVEYGWILEEDVRGNGLGIRVQPGDIDGREGWVPAGDEFERVYEIWILTIMWVFAGEGIGPEDLLPTEIGEEDPGGGGGTKP